MTPGCSVAAPTSGQALWGELPCLGWPLHWELLTAP